MTLSYSSQPVGKMHVIPNQIFNWQYIRKLTNSRVYQWMVYKS